MSVGILVFSPRRQKMSQYTDPQDSKETKDGAVKALAAGGAVLIGGVVGGPIGAAAVAGVMALIKLSKKPPKR
jgi:hypothetical protein